MDLAKVAQDLIDRHARQTERLPALVRATARQHYYAGVSDLMRALQLSAVSEEQKQQLAPLAVQPTHSAQPEDLNALQK